MIKCNRQIDRTSCESVQTYVKGGGSYGANVIPLIFGPQYDITEDSAKTLELTVIEQINSNLL